MRRRRRSSKSGYGSVVKFSTRFKGGRGTAMMCQAPMPQIYLTRHPYFQTTNTTEATGFFLRTYVVNDMFDIDGAGGDVGFAAAMSTFYRDYVVLACAYEITMVNLETDTSANFGVLFWPSSQPPTDFQTFQFRPGAQSKVLSAAGSGHQQQTLKGYVNLKQLFGTNIASEEEFWGDGTTTPTRTLRCYVATSSNLGADSIAFQTRVNFTLYVKWFNRNSIGTPAALARGLPATMTLQIEQLEGQLFELKSHKAKHALALEDLVV